MTKIRATPAISAMPMPVRWGTRRITAAPHFALKDLQGLRVGAVEPALGAKDPGETFLFHQTCANLSCPVELDGVSPESGRHVHEVHRAALIPNDKRLPDYDALRLHLVPGLVGPQRPPRLHIPGVDKILEVAEIRDAVTDSRTRPHPAFGLERIAQSGAGCHVDQPDPAPQRRHKQHAIADVGQVGDGAVGIERPPPELLPGGEVEGVQLAGHGADVENVANDNWLRPDFTIEDESIGRPGPHPRAIDHAAHVEPLLGRAEGEPIPGQRRPTNDGALDVAPVPAAPTQDVPPLQVQGNHLPREAGQDDVVPGEQGRSVHRLEIDLRLRFVALENPLGLPPELVERHGRKLVAVDEDVDGIAVEYGLRPAARLGKPDAGAGKQGNSQDHGEEDSGSEHNVPHRTSNPPDVHRT